MAFKVTNMPADTDPSISQWMPPDLSGGLVLTDLPMNIKDNQSSSMSDMWFKEKVLTKRYGQEISASLGEPILAMYDKKFNSKVVLHVGTRLLEIDLEDF